MSKAEAYAEVSKTPIEQVIALGLCQRNLDGTGLIFAELKIGGNLKENEKQDARAGRLVDCWNALVGVEKPEEFVMNLARAFVQSTDALRVVEVAIGGDESIIGILTQKTIDEAKAVAKPVFETIVRTGLLAKKDV